MKGKMHQDLYRELFEVENSHWWHHHKRGVVHQMIRKFTRKGRVLDVGTGTGKILEELQRKGWEVTGVDGEKEAIIWCKKRGVIVKQADINKEKLPFAAAKFDLVLMLDVLEHISDEQGIIKEIKRALKPGGVLIVTVPAYQWLYSYWDKMMGHERRYSCGSLKKLMANNGFNILYLSYFSCLVLFPAILVRFFKSLFKVKEEPISDFQTLPLKLISEPILRSYVFLEQILLKFVKLPFGLSLILVARKL